MVAGQKLFEGFAELGRDGRWSACRAIDEDVDEPAVGGGLLFVPHEDADFVAHARAADVRDAEASFDRLWKADRSRVRAVGLDEKCR